MAVRLKSALCAGVVTLLSASAAASAEICVTCTGPDAKYACVVNTSTAGTIDTVVKLYCITALAKAGPHASCAIDRNTKAPCQGVRKELPLPGALEQALDNPQEPQTATPALNSPSPGAPGALPAPFRSSAARGRRCRFATSSSQGCATEDGSGNDGERREVGGRRLFRNTEVGRQSGEVDDHGSRKGRLGCRQRGENVVEMPVVVLLELLEQFVGIDGSQGTLSFRSTILSEPT